MRTPEEVLDFLEEQLEYLEIEAKQEGLKVPITAKLSEPNQESLEIKYWLYTNLKWFIQEEL